MNNEIDLTNIRALAIDMDGVLWRGNTALPGLQKFFNLLHQFNISYMLATNNASKTPAEYQRKLAGMGVHIEQRTVLTSSLATAAYLQTQLPHGGRVYVVGQSGLLEAMRDAGFEVMPDSSQPVDVVVAGIDFTLTYDKLRHATLLISRGARFVGSNGDVTFPAEEGDVPGAGSILAAIQAATGVKPVTIGKPEPLMFEIAMQKMGSDPAHTAMLGDRLETDILGGQRAGLTTLMVTTGVDSEASIPVKGVVPDAIFSGIDQLADVWRSQLSQG